MFTKLLLSVKNNFIPLIILVVAVISGILVYYRLRTFSFVQLQQESESIPSTQLALSEEENDQILSDIQENGVSCALTDNDGVVTVGICAVDKVVGNYAKGSMPRAYWLATKTEGKWKVVITGNGIPKCQEIDRYSIPTEIYGNCIESSGLLRFESGT